MIKVIYMLFAIGLIMTAASANDSFIVTSLKDAKMLSESTKKPILLIFGADYCKYCNELKSDLFASPLKELTDNYIICYVDVDKEPNIKSYSVTMIPDSRVIKNNREIAKIKGYSSNNYVRWIKNVK